MQAQGMDGGSGQTDRGPPVVFWEVPSQGQFSARPMVDDRSKNTAAFAGPSAFVVTPRSGPKIGRWRTRRCLQPESRALSSHLGRASLQRLTEHLRRDPAARDRTESRRGSVDRLITTRDDAPVTGAACRPSRSDRSTGTVTARPHSTLVA